MSLLRRAIWLCGFNGLELYVSRTPMVHVSLGVTRHVSWA